jgi:hypothetical protein
MISMHLPRNPKHQIKTALLTLPPPYTHKENINFVIWTGDDTSHANDSYFDPGMVLAANAFVAQSLSQVYHLSYNRQTIFFFLK